MAQDEEGDIDTIGVEKMKEELKYVREAIAYKGENNEDEFVENAYRDMCIDEILPMEYYHLRYQEWDQLCKLEERLVRDLSSVGVDASRESERMRDEQQEVDLDDD